MKRSFSLTRQVQEIPGRCRACAQGDVKLAGRPKAWPGTPCGHQSLQNCKTTGASDYTKPHCMSTFPESKEMRESFTLPRQLKTHLLLTEAQSSTKTQQVLAHKMSPAQGSDAEELKPLTHKTSPGDSRAAEGRQSDGEAKRAGRKSGKDGVKHLAATI